MPLSVGQQQDTGADGLGTAVTGAVFLGTLSAPAVVYACPCLYLAARQASLGTSACRARILGPSTLVISVAVAGKDKGPVGQDGRGQTLT